MKRKNINLSNQIKDKFYNTDEQGYYHREKPKFKKYILKAISSIHHKHGVPWNQKVGMHLFCNYSRNTDSKTKQRFFFFFFSMLKPFCLDHERNGVFSS